jgi:hypothetical protein
MYIIKLIWHRKVRTRPAGTPIRAGAPHHAEGDNGKHRCPGLNLGPIRTYPTAGVLGGFVQQQVQRHGRFADGRGVQLADLCGAGVRGVLSGEIVNMSQNVCAKSH